MDGWSRLDGDCAVIGIVEMFGGFGDRRCCECYSHADGRREEAPCRNSCIAGFAASKRSLVVLIGVCQPPMETFLSTRAVAFRSASQNHGLEIFSGGDAAVQISLIVINVLVE